MEAQLRRLALALALACIPRVARAETRPHYGGTVEAALLGAPGTLDPLTAQSHAEITVVHLVYDALYCVEADGVPQPQLASGAPQLDPARTTARIAIRRGVKFHDGSELTARDVVAALERARKGPGKWALAPMTAVRADGDTVELTLRAPVADLAMLLALPQTSITKPVRGGPAVGTGPFTVVALDVARRRLQLKAFDDHFAGRPYLDGLVLRWYDTPDGEARQFETGAAQLSARGVAPFAGAQPTYAAADVQGPASLLVFVGFGRAHASATDDRGFRRALDLALGRGALTTVGAGERVAPSRSPLPVEAGAAVLDPAGRAEAPDAARAVLAEAARKTPALAADKLSALRLEVLVEATRPDDREIAERVVRALDKLGVAAAITALSAAELRDRVASGRCDLWIGQLAEPLTAAGAWWGAAFAAGGDDWASGQLATGHVDGALAGKTFAEHLPIVPLMFRSVRLWHRTDVRGLAFDASGRPDLADLFLFGDPVRAKAKPSP